MSLFTFNKTDEGTAKKKHNLCHKTQETET